MTDRQIINSIIEWDDPMFEFHEGYMGRSCPPEFLRPNRVCGDTCNICINYATNVMRSITMQEYYNSFKSI